MGTLPKTRFSKTTIRSLAEAAGVYLDDETVDIILPVFRVVMASISKLDEIDLGDAEFPLVFLQ